jgi:hypothetical protein
MNNGWRAPVSLLIVALVALAGCRYLPPAADSPEGIVKGAFEAVEASGAGGIARLADFACAAKADAVVAVLGGGAGLGALGVDPKEVLAGTSVDFENLEVSESLKTETDARVRITGTAIYTIDQATFRTIVTKMLEAQGVEPTKKVLDATTAQYADQLTRSAKMKFDMNLVQEDGKWVICT